MITFKVVGTDNKISEIGLFTEENLIYHKEMIIKDALYNYPPERLIDFIPAFSVAEMEKIDSLGYEIAVKIYYEFIVAGGQEEALFSDISIAEFKPLDDLSLICDDNDLIELLMKTFDAFIIL
jgi:hypothetical protein